MTIHTSHNPFLYTFFKIYTILKIRLNFISVKIYGNVSDKDKAILVISNHFSWWDGFWIMYMNMRLFRRKFHFMMLEEQLEKHSFFKKTGGYPVKKGSRSIIESLDYTVRLLGDRNNMVLMFPQGKIGSAYRRQISFETGVKKIIKDDNGRSQIIFSVNLVEYFSGKKPSLFMHITEYTGPAEFESLEKAYQEFYDASVHEHLKLEVAG